MTEEQSRQIEELLRENYRWQIRKSDGMRRAHFFSQKDRMCRGYVTPSSVEDDDEAAYAWADDQQSEQVQLCIDALTVEQRAAVSMTMRNKEVGHAVWSSVRAGDQHANYQAAKLCLLPALKKRGLI